MKLLATHPCIEVKQEIEWLEKKIVEKHYDMKLYDDMITIKEDQYPLTSVFDISYRKKEEDDAIGFIYLHTSKGVRTYYIKEEPTAFIEAYNQLKAVRPDMQ